VSSNPATFTITAPSPPPPSSLPGGGSSLPTITTIVNVSNQYPGLVQMETVTVAVTTPNGAAVSGGVAAIQVDGQTVFASVSNGMAAATVATGLFDVSLLTDLFFAHPLTAGYSDRTGTYKDSSAGASVPSILLDFIFSVIAQELAFLKRASLSPF
jgi:hypothetical protein